MINVTVVEIIGNRILSEGINPKTGQKFKIEDVVNTDYRMTIENYIIVKSGALISETTSSSTTTTTNVS